MFSTEVLESETIHCLNLRKNKDLFLEKQKYCIFSNKVYEVMNSDLNMKTNKIFILDIHNSAKFSKVFHLGYLLVDLTPAHFQKITSS